MKYFELIVTNVRAKRIEGKSTHTTLAQALQMVKNVGANYKAIGEKPRAYKWEITNESLKKEEGELFQMKGFFTLQGIAMIKDILIY